MNNIIHPSSDVQTKLIGVGTKIWQFVVVLSGAKIGSNCNICAHVLIENDVVIGDNVTVKSGVQLWDGLRIEDNVFIGPNVTFTNDKFPRSKQYPERFPQTIVRKGASIGGGGGYSTRTDHWRVCNDRCGCGRYPLSARTCGGSRQSRQNYWLFGGGR